MAAQSTPVRINWALTSMADIREAEKTLPQSDIHAVYKEASRLARKRMEARGAALADLATDIARNAQPPVTVAQVKLELLPGPSQSEIVGRANAITLEPHEGPSQRWLITFEGEHLPGGFCAVPVSLELERETSRHVLDAMDQLRCLLLRGIRYPREGA